MGKHAELSGTARVKRDGSPHTVRFPRNFSSTPKVEFVAPNKPIVELDRIELIECRKDGFVVAVNHPLRGWHSLNWNAYGELHKGAVSSMWPALAAIGGVLGAVLAAYAALVQLGALPNVFAG
jgi:hypothetical protein